jgi:outer membrane protein assembly factor BamA
VAAQQGDTPAPRKNDNPWVDSYFPYISSAPYDFPMVYAHFSYFKKADYYDRSIFVGNFSADAGISFRGSRALILTFDAPLLWPHWRLAARVGTYRQALLGYHGLGNNTTVDKALQDSVSDFYRVSRTRYWVQAEASRELVRRVFVAVGGTYLPSHFSAVSGLSQFRNDYGDDLKDTDVRGSLRLVYDGRNNEYNPKKGLYAEVSGMVGSGGDGYQRYGAVVAGWLPVPITEGTNLAAWIGGSNLTGTPPLNARFEVPVWEQEVPVLGGAQSNRGIPSQRFVGTGVLDARLEARQDIIDAGDFGAVIVFVFTDAGRVFENEPYRITTDGLKVGYGGGLAIRILRSTVITFNFAGGPEGFQFSTGARWPF